MAFIINPVVNINGTPAAITGIDADKPATGSQHGTLYFARDTQKIYQWDQLTLTWVLMASGSGGGGTDTLDDVAVRGNISTVSLIVSDDGTITGGWAVEAATNGSLFLKTNSNAPNDRTEIQPTSITNGGEIFLLPDKLGVTDTFAMLSDIPLRGQYSPTLSNLLNCTLTTAFPLQYKIMRDTVLVWGRLDMQGVLRGLTAQFDIDIPFNPLASNFLNDYETSGSFINGIFNEAGYIEALTGNSTLRVTWKVEDELSDHIFRLNLSYILPGTL